MTLTVLSLYSICFSAITISQYIYVDLYIFITVWNYLCFCMITSWYTSVMDYYDKLASLN